MDILIKGMEMPQQMESPITITIFKNGSVWMNDVTSGKGKLPNAKAIELTPHGDLKDGWVLFSLFERELGSSVIGQRVKNLIVNSPTIVEATE